MSGINGTHPDGGAGARLRVISIGDADRARVLGRDDRLEVVRARDGFEAIGETGFAPIGNGSCPTIVLLSSDAVNAMDMDRFVHAVHLVDPGIRVVVSSATEGTASLIAGLDSIGPDPTPEMLLHLIEAHHDDALAETVGPVEAEPGSSASGPPAKGMASIASDLSALDARTLAAAGARDGPLLWALLAGEDLGEVCLGLIRRELGADVRYVAREDDSTPPPVTSPGECMAPSLHNGTLLGWLIGAHSLRDDLALEAERMALALVVDRQQRQLRDSAFVDHLTGAWNRRYYEKSMATLLTEAREQRLELTLLLFDIDDFKVYNDRYGHAAGDEILIETVRLLSSLVRPSDRVCRIGGDEFAVIFYEPTGPRAPGSHPPRTIFEIATRFQRAILEHRFPKLGEDAHATLSVSGGLATFPWDGHDAESLLEHADRLLIQSKREGKNAICLGPGAMRACN